MKGRYFYRKGSFMNIGHVTREEMTDSFVKIRLRQYYDYGLIESFGNFIINSKHYYITQGFTPTKQEADFSLRFFYFMEDIDYEERGIINNLFNDLKNDVAIDVVNNIIRNGQ